MHLIPILRSLLLAQKILMMNFVLPQKYYSIKVTSYLV